MKLLFPLLFAICLMVGCSPQKEKERFYQKNSVIYDSRDNKPYTGVVAVNAEGNTMEYEVKNGVKNGFFRIIDKKGQIIMKGDVADNRNTGKWEYFYNNGSIESEGNFTEDIPNGIWKWYFPSGQLKETGKFISGQRDSTWVTYDEAGKVLMEKVFINGIEQTDSL